MFVAGGVRVTGVKDVIYLTNLNQDRKKQRQEYCMRLHTICLFLIVPDSTLCRLVLGGSSQSVSG